jgi:protein MpaA
VNRRRALTAALVGIACGIALIVVADAVPEEGGMPTAPDRESQRRDPPSRGTADPKFLAFALTPRRPGNLLSRGGVAGRSGQGRQIRLLQYGDPAIHGEVLVFGCIHGDECEGRSLRPLTAITSFCPDWASDVYVVPNLNPDGATLGTRLNGRGVDLNRNFPAAWKPIGTRGSPQYSGPRAFSEREARLGARIVARLRPDVTIWFHQQHAPRPLVRAWGGSVAAAASYAQLAKLPFRRMPWPAGTAPNWQNHRYPAASSFVVELPRGEIGAGLKARLERAIVRLARQVGKD